MCELTWLPGCTDTRGLRRIFEMDKLRTIYVERLKHTTEWIPALHKSQVFYYLVFRCPKISFSSLLRIYLLIDYKAGYIIDSGLRKRKQITI